MKRLLKNAFQPSLSSAIAAQPATQVSVNAKKDEELERRVGKSRQEIIDLMKILRTF
ncbi:hypothetical protein [Chryseolinea serpens]|uniref:hypothetical protein n=1 Tax=Chryseolinea serpens TaxID=947013 RepID=UPI0015BE0A87|nr:hypothetical protein [Chryseolinea serpens]